MRHRKDAKQVAPAEPAIWSRREVRCDLCRRVIDGGDPPRRAAIGGVAGVHDLHLWTITSGVEALSAHVVL